MKPSVNDVLEIMQMKAQVTALYQEIDQRILEMKETFGEGRFDYEIDLPNTDGNVVGFAEVLKGKGDFFKFEIEDSLAKLQSGEVVFRSVSMKPVSFSSRSLKRRPDSLK